MCTLFDSSIPILRSYSYKWIVNNVLTDSAEKFYNVLMSKREKKERREEGRKKRREGGKKVGRKEGKKRNLQCSKIE